jgi:hypothetical protein
VANPAQDMLGVGGNDENFLLHAGCAAGRTVLLASKALPLQS